MNTTRTPSRSVQFVLMIGLAVIGYVAGFLVSEVWSNTTLSVTIGLIATFFLLGALQMRRR